MIVDRRSFLRAAVVAPVVLPALDPVLVKGESFQVRGVWFDVKDIVGTLYAAERLPANSRGPAIYASLEGGVRLGRIRPGIDSLLRTRKKTAAMK